MLYILMLWCLNSGFSFVFFIYMNNIVTNLNTGDYEA